MSYDLYLRDPVTREELEVPPHMMYGGTIKCEEINGVLVPTTTTEAYLNITYNYSGYYHDAFSGKEENQKIYEKDKKLFNITDPSGGIRTINGMTGLMAICVLHEMIRRIEEKYRMPDGWITTERKKVWYENREDNRIQKDSTDLLMEYYELQRNGMSDEEAGKNIDDRWKRCEGIVRVNEGETDNYWHPTAANAIRPLYQLIALSQMRPDGIWSEES